MFALKRLAPFARSAIPALKELMTNNDPHLRIVAATTIGKIAPEDPSTVPILVAALDDPNSLNRATACEFLGERKHSAVLNTMKLFNDPDFLVRFAASKPYGKFTGNWLHVVAICVAALKDDNETNRAIGAECLLSIRRFVQDHLDLLQIGGMNSKLNVAYSYSWLLPSGDIAQVQDIIESLRQYAIDLGGEAVGPVAVLTGSEAQALRSNADHVITFTAIVPNAKSEGGPQRYGLGFSLKQNSWSWSGIVRVSSFKEIGEIMHHAASLGIFVGTTFAGMVMEYKRNAEGEIEVDQRPAFDLDAF